MEATIRKGTDLKSLSDYVVSFCQLKGYTISPLKLQKILYYTQAWSIGKFERDTLFEELPEAWVNGPVYRRIYDIYKGDFYKNTPIRTDLPLEALTAQTAALRNSLGLNSERLKLVDAVIDYYGKMDEGKLVAWTHSEPPWLAAREGLSPIEISTNKLSVDLIYQHFKR